MSYFLLALGTIFFFLVSYALLEVCEKYLVTEPHRLRKVAHSALTLLLLSASHWLTEGQFVLVCGLFAGLFLGVRNRHKMKAIHLPSRESYGEVLLPVGLAGAALLSYNNPFIFSATVLMVAFADPFAELFGVKGVKKSLRGSLAFFITSVVILFGAALVLPVALTFHFALVTLLTAISATLAERFSKKGWDNVTIPVVVSLILFITL